VRSIDKEKTKNSSLKRRKSQNLCWREDTNVLEPFVARLKSNLMVPDLLKFPKPFINQVFFVVTGDTGGSTHDGGGVEKQASLDTNLYLYQVRLFTFHFPAVTDLSLALMKMGGALRQTVTKLERPPSAR